MDSCVRYEKPLTRIESKRGKTFVCAIFFMCLALSLWFTPLPNAQEESCDRPCHELEWPRICRLRFVLESYNIPRSSCSNNDTNYCSNDQLFEYNYHDRLFTVNQRIPAPTIHVCRHDILLVDVVNRIPDRSVSVHWRGQLHAKSALMDGVPMVTQCPIISYTTFQYKFRASHVGTHTWHLHNDENDAITNRIHGMLVVRESVHKEVHSNLIDHDESSHTITLRAVQNFKQSLILVNDAHPTRKSGKSNIVFELRKNKRYRFRVAHNGGNVPCPITGSVNKHNLLVIALDGNPIEPIYTKEFSIVIGERLDFVLQTDQIIDEYIFKFSFDENCRTKWNSYATIKYVVEEGKKPTKLKQNDGFRLTSKFTTQFDPLCGISMTCLENVESIPSHADALFDKKVDAMFYLSFGYYSIQSGTFRGTYEVPHINNVSFLYPPSPLASQLQDVPANIICRNDDLSEACSKQTQSTHCHCTRIINVVAGSVVELVLAHTDVSNVNSTKSHVFHLHGHKFFLIRRQMNVHLNGIDNNIVNSTKPVLKDTISIPANGLAVIRFVVAQTGFWLLREENTAGMELVFNVVDSIYEIPASYPRCGNFIGPKYFLT